jgi:hypothetical protein
MEFILYLNSISKDIINSVIQARYLIGENIELCRHPMVNGSTSYPPNKFIICTENIKRRSSNVSAEISKTVIHEAVHVAQRCKNNTLLGDYNQSQISHVKQSNLRASLSATSDKNNSYRMEHEAYYLEEIPEKVLFYVKKYCL